MTENLHAAIRATFDKLGAAIFVLAHDARILFANTAAEEVLAEGKLLRAQDGYLRGRDMPATTRLRHAISGVARSDRDASRSFQDLALTLRSDNQPAAVGSILALPSPEGTAVLFVSQADRGGRYPEAALRVAFGLSLIESRVAERLAQAATPSDIALALDLSINTVKSHLRRIYKKTGTEGQAGLQRLIQEFSVPVRD
jgi:DNA-binding CsgD family transcriptional regulator